MGKYSFNTVSLIQSVTDKCFCIFRTQLLDNDVKILWHGHPHSSLTRRFDENTCGWHHHSAPKLEAGIIGFQCSLFSQQLCLALNGTGWRHKMFSSVQNSPSYPSVPHIWSHYEAYIEINMKQLWSKFPLFFQKMKCYCGNFCLLPNHFKTVVIEFSIDICQAMHCAL